MSITLIRRNMDPNSLAGGTNFYKPSPTPDPNELFFAMNKDYYFDKSKGFITRTYGNNLWEFKVSEAYWCKRLSGMSPEYIKITSDEQLRDLVTAYMGKKNTNGGIFSGGYNTVQGAILRFRLSDVDQTSIKHTKLNMISYLPFINKRLKHVQFDQLLHQKVEQHKKIMIENPIYKNLDDALQFRTVKAEEFIKDNQVEIEKGRARLNKKSPLLRNTSLALSFGAGYYYLNKDDQEDIIKSNIEKYEPFFKEIGEKINNIPTPAFKTTVLGESIEHLKFQLSPENVTQTIKEKMKSNDVSPETMVVLYIESLHDLFDGVLSQTSEEPEEVKYDFAFPEYLEMLNKTFLNIFDICKNQLIVIGVDLNTVPQLQSTIEKYNVALQKNENKNMDFFSYIRENKKLLQYLGGILGVASIAYILYKYRNKIKERVKNTWNKITNKDVQKDE